MNGAHSPSGIQPTSLPLANPEFRSDDPILVRDWDFVPLQGYSQHVCSDCAAALPTGW